MGIKNKNKNAVVLGVRVRVLHLHSLTSSSGSHPSPTHHTSSAPATTAMPQLRENQVFFSSPSLLLSLPPSAAEPRRVLITPIARATGSGVEPPAADPCGGLHRLCGESPRLLEGRVHARPRGSCCWGR